MTFDNGGAETTRAFCDEALHEDLRSARLLHAREANGLSRPQTKFPIMTKPAKYNA
jgi:hypothetical protein